jgi:hypothetical protein
VISVRWDGDKVRGIRMELRDGTVKSAGGIDDVNYTLSSYTFAEGETLKSLSFSSSGYGYGSLRRLDLTTSNGGKFSAGPTGVDDLVVSPVLGAQLVGFHAWVNPDNFINAIVFHATDDMPLAVSVLNYSPWTCAYANGVVTIDGKNAIQVSDAGGDKHGMNTSHQRIVGEPATDRLARFDQDDVMSLPRKASANMDCGENSGCAPPPMIAIRINGVPVSVEAALVADRQYKIHKYAILMEKEIASG